MYTGVVFWWSFKNAIQDQINYALILFMFLKSSEVIKQSPFQIDYINIFFDRDRNNFLTCPQMFEIFPCAVVHTGMKQEKHSWYPHGSYNWDPWRKILNKKTCWELDRIRKVIGIIYYIVLVSWSRTFNNLVISSVFSFGQIFIDPLLCVGHRKENI